MSQSFPTETAGLPDVAPSTVVDVADGDCLRAARRTGREAARRAHGAHARRTTARSPGRRCASARAPRSRRRRQRGRPRDNRALARAAAGEPLRRDPRDAGADPGRRQLHLPRAVPRSRRRTGTTRTSERTTPRTWACTATSWSCRPSGLLAAGAPRAPAHARRHPARGRRLARSAATRRRTSAMGRFGNVLLVAGEPDLQLGAGTARSSGFYLTNTANTRVFNVGVAGARMKLVGGDSGRVEHEEFVEASCWRRPSASSSTCCSTSRARWCSSTGPRAAPTRWRRSTSPTSRATVAPRGVRDACATTPRWRAERAALDAWPRPSRRTRRSPSSPRWTLGGPPSGERRDLHLPDASRGHQRGARTLPEVRHEAACRRRCRPAYACPMHPDVASDAARALPEVRHEAGRLRTRSHARRGPPSRRDHAHERRPASTATGTARAGGIEWEDDMVEVNRMTTPANMRWKIVDRDDRRGEPRDRLAVPGRGPGQDPAGQRDGLGPPDAPPVPRPRGRALPRPRPRRRRRSRTWSGRTRCWCAPARPSTSCSTSRTPAAGWRTATSPSTTRAG